MLVLQVLLYYLFKRLATPKKPKNWGIVYDKSDKRPINRAVARLFSKQFNKLVATEITDNNGRYSFMVGPNEYYITFDKNGYAKTTSPGIRIKEKNEVVKVDIGMEKAGMHIETPPEVPIPPVPASSVPVSPPPAPPVVLPVNSARIIPPPSAPPVNPPTTSPPPQNLPVQ